ncbi:MAG: hypothetical protein ACR2KB_14730 [Chitinophagaceae bacterium]
MIKKLRNILKGGNGNEMPIGLGVGELPNKIYHGKQPIKSSDFKQIINNIFLPQIQSLGFTGKDFYFFRHNEDYTEVIYPWTYKTGGAIQVDLLVKINKISYPDDKEAIKPGNIKPENAEFQWRLSPNEGKNKNGQHVWYWIFEKEYSDNLKIAEDIWRLFSIKGVEYFNRFKNHQLYISQITIDNYLDFPDFFIQRFFGRHEAGIIYFLFDYWRQFQDEKRAAVFAKLGLTKLNNEEHHQYLTVFKNYLGKAS